eukprot:TRINITY_DN779813_c0_g1_i1.p1 TRINITY_DN779813_c0_g1~~TRINITY_DN779813_c0_g1_i1.p1  ORF type:complete len:229 (-),score=48.71 TRINITY_DN779813_c0_g1_i1:3-689(-)
MPTKAELLEQNQRLEAENTNLKQEVKKYKILVQNNRYFANQDHKLKHNSPYKVFKYLKNKNNRNRPYRDQAKVMYQCSRKIIRDILKDETRSEYEEYHSPIDWGINAPEVGEHITDFINGTAEIKEDEKCLWFCVEIGNIINSHDDDLCQSIANKTISNMEFNGEDETVWEPLDEIAMKRLKKLKGKTPVDLLEELVKTFSHWDEDTIQTGHYAQSLLDEPEEKIPRT